ncbi:hypothetical protein [Jeotgalibacillus malaysiensis]|uniref:hypothetical protein n=1 Tax=Jeotgalibacillus malaysiensis TaxID=1508404 RepID=UPI00384D0852
MSEFSEFLREKNEMSKAKEIQWEQVKSEWIQTVEDFMEELSGWVEDERQKGLVKIEKTQVKLTEEELGAYAVSSLKMRVGKTTVNVTPIARLVVGATGRIDVFGEFSRYIVLDHKDRGWIYRKEGQGGAYKKFDKRAFLEMVMEIIS